jgi:hypothetical protein
MSDPTEPAPAGEPGLDQKIAKIEQRVVELDQIQARSRRASLIVLLVVAAEFALFALMTRRHVAANFNDQDVQKAIADRLPDLTPLLRDNLVRVSEHAMPVYREQAMARLQVAGPAIAREAMAKLEKLPEENGEEMQKRLDNAFAKAMTRLEPDIRSTYPTLSDEQKNQIMRSEFKQLIDEQNEAVAMHITDIYVKEQESTRTVLDKFDIPGDVGKMSATARQRELLHALVDVIMDGDIKLDLSTIGPPAKTASSTANDTDISVLAKPAAASPGN